MISETALLELIRDSVTAGPDGITCAEIASITGKHDQGARKLVADLIKQGKLEFAGRGKRQAIDGTMRPVPLYRVK